MRPHQVSVRCTVVCCGCTGVGIEEVGQLHLVSRAIALCGVIHATTDDRIGHVLYGDGLGVGSRVAGAIRGHPLADDGVVVRAVAVDAVPHGVNGHKGDRGVSGVHAVVGCGHGRHSRKGLIAVDGDVGRGVVKRGVGGVISGPALLHGQCIAAIQVDGCIDQGYVALLFSTGIEGLEVLDQIQGEVSRSIGHRRSVKGAIVVEPTARAEFTVAVVGRFTHLESEIGDPDVRVHARHVRQLDQGAFQTAFSREVAESRIHQVDVPRVGCGIPHGVDRAAGHGFEAACPVRAGSFSVVNGLDVQNGRRVVDVHHLSSDHSHPILVGGEGHTVSRGNELAVIT